MKVENKRAYSRVDFPCFANVVLHRMIDTVSVMDLSVSGIRISNNIGLKVNDKVLLSIPFDNAAELKLSAVVSRMDDRTAGLKISPTNISSLMNLTKSILIAKSKAKPHSHPPGIVMTEYSDQMPILEVV